MSANAFESAMDWLMHSQCQSIIEAKLDDSLLHHYTLLDRARLPCWEVNSIGLELHYADINRVDVSIFGGIHVARAAGNRIPDWLQRWRVFLEARGVATYFPQHFWLEYDFTSRGYELAGLFQKCELTSFGPKDIADLLDDYHGFVQDGGGGYVVGGGSQWLEDFFDRFGSPKWIGLMARDERALKLIVDLNSLAVKKLREFLNTYYAATLEDTGINPQSIEKAIEQWIQHGVARMSIDYILGGERVGKRLCFELLPPGGSTSVKSNDYARLLGQIELDLKVPAEQVNASAKILQKLPYYSLRPRFNLLSQDLFAIAFNHAKICICDGSTFVKDYFLVAQVKG
jgi:hypothetical protein